MKNKVIFMCGSHMRHLYIAEKFLKEGRLAGLVIEEREEFLPQPPENLVQRDKDNFILHFAKRDEAEREFFGNVERETLLASVPVLHTTMEELNSQKTIEFIKSVDADMLLTYGVHMVSDEVISCYEGKAFNIHGGLSPWYRGNTTLFWPFYFLKPNYAGMTIHRLTQKLDGGDILHHSVPTLEYNDTMHVVACKAVKKVAEDICKILDCRDNGAAFHCSQQKNSGKLFLGKDWTPQTLRVIYELFDDKIVDMYLNGELERDEPKLVNFFEGME